MDINLENLIGGDAFNAEGHICPYCGKTIAPFTFYLNGKKHTSQPICECEAKADEKFKRSLEKRERKERFEQKYSTLACSSKYKSCRFDNFELDEKNQAAYTAAIRFAQSYPVGVNLFIHGRPGNGKSHLAAAIAGQLNSDETIIVFSTFTEALEKIRATFSGSNDNEAAIIGALTACDLLILDDLGVEKPSEFSCDVLYRIVDSRMRNERVTVYTSNYSPAALGKRYGKIIGMMEAERLIGRIVNQGEVVENFAASRRNGSGRNGITLPETAKI